MASLRRGFFIGRHRAVVATRSGAECLAGRMGLPRREFGMSGNGRLDRRQKPPRLKISLTVILLALFAAAGIAVTLVLSHFDASMPTQPLGP
jgi:hypothetical protein